MTETILIDANGVKHKATPQSTRSATTRYKDGSESAHQVLGSGDLFLESGVAVEYIGNDERSGERRFKDEDGNLYVEPK